MTSTKKMKKFSFVLLILLLLFAFLVMASLGANAQTRFNLIDKTSCKVFDNRSGITCIRYDGNFQTFFWNNYTQARTLPKIGRKVDIYYYRGTYYLYDWFQTRYVRNNYFCNSQHRLKIARYARY